MKGPRHSAWRAALFAAAACAAGVGSSSDGSAVVDGCTPIRSNAAFVAHQNTRTPISGHRCWRVGGCGFGVQASRGHFGLASTVPLFATTTADGDPSGASGAASDEHIERPPLSEKDAIRILCASPRHNTEGGQIDRPEDMRACGTSLDVLYVLGRAYVHPSFISNLSAEQLSSNVESIVDSISPNLAAAALRRLSSPPFLPGPGGRRYRDHRNQLEISETERHVYDELMKLLLERLTSVMECQMSDLASLAVRRGSINATLLSQKDIWVVPPSDEANTLNWYGLADLMHSISSLCNVLGKRNKGGNIIQAHLLTNISPEEQISMMNLCDSVVDYLSWDDKMASSFVRCVGPRRLVRDTIQPLASMVLARRKLRRQMEEQWACGDGKDGGIADVSEELLGDCSHLMAILSSYLILPHALDKLTALDLSATLQSLTRVYGQHSGGALGQTPGQSLLLQKPQWMLIRAFMKRLRKYSVRSSDNGKGLVQALQAAARLIGYLEEQTQTTVQPLATQKVLPLPMSLPGEDGNRAPSFALPLEKGAQSTIAPSSAIATNPATDPRDVDDIPLEKLREEAVIMLHTILNDIVHPPKYRANKSPTKNGSERANGETKLQALNLGEIADLLLAATTLDPRGIDPATIRTILRHLTSGGVLQRCRSCRDLSRLLLSLQRLRIGTGSNGLGHEEKEADGLQEQCVRLLGERFLDIVRWHQEHSNRHACDAKTLVTALRSAVLMFPGESAATAAMLDAAKMLVLEEADDDTAGIEDWGSSTFLSRCNEYEVSNLLFAFALAKRFEEGIFVALTDQLLEEHVLESCSSSSASRAMWSCAMLLSLEEACHKKGSDFAPGGSYLQERQVDLFHQLAPQLLFSPLSPTDASCAMWAWAKSEYVLDRGIFDAMAESLATETLLWRANTRLISQALWACGRMVEFDSYESDGDMPPYVKCVDKYLHFLIANKEQMTPKHISQSIWAIGRLQNYFALNNGGSHLHIDEMAEIALSKGASLNSREVANCVWGLSKVGCDEPEIILELIHHIISSPEHTANCAAQEAATMMFALGQLNVYDAEAFACLSNVLKSRLHEADSQTISNALFAHDAVGIVPPSELLSTWAQTKLGLGTAVLGNDDDIEKSSTHRPATTKDGER